MGPQPQEMLGRYKLLALLAKGGMAEIYLARQTGIQGFERLAVVKRILPHLAKEKRFLDMFFDEARIAAQLNHPNIVQIYELGQQDEHYFIAMEYLEGESLAYLIHEAKRTGQILPPELAAGIIIQVCDGLDYAHTLADDNGKPLHIVHRDVSPQNIIVLFNGSVKLVDFGIAKAASQTHQTRVGTLKGKLSYMSPEQCSSGEMDARSDVFSLGIVLWELLSRQRLFKRRDEVGTIHAIAYEVVKPIRAIRPEVPEALEAVAMRALQKDPAARFPGTGEMAEALRNFLRKGGAVASPREISTFVNKVFADRARTKKKILDDIRKSDGRQISLGVLKPDTYESLPPGSDESEAEEDAPASPVPPPLKAAPVSDTHAIAEAIAEVVGKDAGVVQEVPDGATEISSLMQPIRRNFKPLLWTLPLVLILGFGIWWLAAGPHEEKSDLAGGPLQGQEPAGAAADAGMIEDHGQGTGATPDAGNAGSDPRLERQPSRLFVRSIPSGCKVEVDGKEAKGTTPLADLAVDPDKSHVVTVACARYQQQTKSVALGAGESGELSFSLTPVKPAAGQAFGLLKFDTEPWSDVYLGKRKLGTTPITGVRLPAGTHTITAVNSEMGISRNFQVTIEAGKTATIFKELGK